LASRRLQHDAKPGYVALQDLIVAHVALSGRRTARARLSSMTSCLSAVSGSVANGHHTVHQPT
jgi:hypothetical protein